MDECQTKSLRLPLEGASRIIQGSVIYYFIVLQCICQCTLFCREVSYVVQNGQNWVQISQVNSGRSRLSWSKWISLIHCYSPDFWHSLLWTVPQDVFDHRKKSIYYQLVL